MLLTHYGQNFEHIAKLFDPVTQTYVWAHALVTLPYSDDDTDYPALFQLWKPVDLTRLAYRSGATQSQQIYWPRRPFSLATV